MLVETQRTSHSQPCVRGRELLAQVMPTPRPPCQTEQYKSCPHHDLLATAHRGCCLKVAERVQGRVALRTRGEGVPTHGKDKVLIHVKDEVLTRLKA
jgi:hypothetical protein